MNNKKFFVSLNKLSAPRQVCKHFSTSYTGISLSPKHGTTIIGLQVVINMKAYILTIYKLNLL